jgi:hypothetical protein
MHYQLRSHSTVFLTLAHLQYILLRASTLDLVAAIHIAEMNIGHYPKEYNPRIHGIYNPASYYGKRKIWTETF